MTSLGAIAVLNLANGCVPGTPLLFRPRPPGSQRRERTTCAIGDVRLDRRQPVDLDAFYQHLQLRGGPRRSGLSAQAVLEIRRVLSGALDLAVDRHLIDADPARSARPPRPEHHSTVPAV